MEQIADDIFTKKIHNCCETGTFSFIIIIRRRRHRRSIQWIYCIHKYWVKWVNNSKCGVTSNGGESRARTS